MSFTFEAAVVIVPTRVGGRFVVSLYSRGRDAVAVMRLTSLGARMVLISVPADDSNARLGALTPAERQVVRLAAEGHTDGDIAALRRTTAATVSKQITAAYRKLGISGRRELRAQLAGGGEGPQRPEEAPDG